MTTLQYNRLRKDEIRLLTIRQDRVLGLSTHCLTDLPAYTALSYAWGSPDDLVNISIGPHQLYVTRNLDEALHHLQPGVYWIDAICINQADFDERAQQVSQMSKIYKNAAVTAWLGAAAEEAFEIMETVYQHVQYDEKTGSWSGDEHWRMMQASVMLTEAQCTILDEFFLRSWFSRLWVRQEVAHAKEIIVQCGSSSITWSKLCTAAFFDSGSASNAARALLSLQDSPLLDFLDTGRLASCTDPHDRVYAIVSMRRHDDTVLQDFSFDYRQTAQETFMRSVELCVDYHRDLDVLACAGRGSLPGLPTWAPDWTSTYRSIWRVHYSMAGLRLRRPPFKRTGQVASVKGKSLTTIRKLMPLRADDGLIEYEQCLRDAISSLHGYTREDLCRVLTQNNIVERVAGRHSRTIRYRDIREAVRCLELVLNEEEGTQSEYLERVYPGKSVQTHEDHLMALVPMRIHCLERSLADTTEGLALVPASSQVGDTIAVIAGAQAPMVLRAVEVDHFEVVGDAYSSKYMAAEAILGSLPENVEYALRFEAGNGVWGFRHSKTGHWQVEDPRLDGNATTSLQPSSTSNEQSPVYDLALDMLPWLNLV